VTEDQEPARPAYKQCPDCAERVLAAARKCRYCGYRFDGRRRSAGGSLLMDLLGPLRRDTTGTTFEEVFADWGTALGEGEDVEWFHLADVDHHPGYLLVTSRRLVFFNQTSLTTHERAFEYPLTLLSDVRMSGRGAKRRLELRVGTLGHAVQGPRGSELEQLGGYLERVLTENHPVPTQPPRA
jgi:Uncharacterised protein family UPF0547